MDFAEKVRSGVPVVTVEFGPPKGTGVSGILESAGLLRGKVDAVNVTDQQGSIMRLGALAVSSILAARGFEPVFQVTCRDRNRLALQSDILSAAALGVRNLLCLTGDHPALGDHPQAMPVFDLDSVQLLQAVQRLEEGTDMNGNRLEGSPPRFFTGAAVNPGADPLEPEIIKMEKKVAAGAEFFQTQAVFDAGVFENFLARTRHLKVSVIAGIVMLKSAGMARYLNRNVPGINVPEGLIAEMEAATDKVAASVAISAGLIKELLPMCQGIHLMPIGWARHVPRVLEAAGIKPTGTTA